MQITYEKLIQDSISLAWKIPKNKYKYIFPIPNGGIAPGIVIGTMLEKVKILSLAEYKKHPNPEEVLIIDDIVDSWATIKRYTRGSDVATVYKKNYAPAPKYWVEETVEWSEFPHEKEEVGIEEHIIHVLQFLGYNQTINFTETDKLINLLKSVLK